MDIALSQDEVIENLWREYKKTSEYSQGLVKGIPSHHPIVEAREAVGLKEIYGRFLRELETASDFKRSLRERSIGHWLEEWKKMHSTLFKYILRERGSWRSHDVRFGHPGDEDIYHIPSHTAVPREMNQLAKRIHCELNRWDEDDVNELEVLAKVHYQFIRIHPFADGNGRIARVLVDQLATHFGLPPAIAGYPRHDRKRRAQYHTAIRACADDPQCGELALWIKGYIDIQLGRLA